MSTENPQSLNFYKPLAVNFQTFFKMPIKALKIHSNKCHVLNLGNLVTPKLIWGYCHNLKRVDSATDTDQRLLVARGGIEPGPRMSNPAKAYMASSWIS